MGLRSPPVGGAPGPAVARLRRKLLAAAEPSVKSWWEGYVKGGHPFLGIRMDGVRRAVRDWVREEGLPVAVPPSPGGTEAGPTGLTLADQLLRLPYTEEKLAGVLFLSEWLLPRSFPGCRKALPLWAHLFQEGAIADWNVCDWFCVKVLGPLVAAEGKACAAAIGDWRTATTLWQRRASAVAFVNLAKKGDENFPGFTNLVLESCDALLRDPARFSQTGAGWVLRELSRPHPERLTAFIQERVGLFSREALRSATRTLPEDERRRLLEKGIQGSGR